MKLTNMIIGPIMVVLIFTGFAYFLVDGISSYGVTAPTGSMNNTLATFNKIYGRTNDTTNQVQSQLTDTSISNIGNLVSGTVGSFIEFSGLFLGAGFQAAVTTTQTITNFREITDSMSADITLGPLGTMLKGIIFTIIILLFMIGILVAFVTRSERA